MKKVIHIVSFLLFFAAISGVSSCKTGYGCPAEEAYEKSKERPLDSKKRGKSRLFKKK